MNDVPPIELLESTHEFPGPFTFKAVGWSEEGFAARVVSAVRDELDAEADPPHSLRESRGGRHVAVTLEPHVQSAEEVLAVYERLRAVRGLIVLM